MQNLFEKVVSISNSYNNTALNESMALENHITEIFDLILENHEENVLLSARSGRKFAIILIWHEKSRKRGIVNISKLFYPHEPLQEKLDEYEIQSLMSRLKDYFLPFTLQIHNLYDFLNNHFNLQLKISLDYYILTINW